MEDIYGPEDIEKLLLSKDFSELYPEERTYVLKHIEDEDEYTAMRMMLLDVTEADDVLTTPKPMRDVLLAMHESKHSSPSFRIWLNSLFSSLTPTVGWRRPALQLAGIVGIVLVSTVTYRLLVPSLDSKELAETPQHTEDTIEEPKYAEKDFEKKKSEVISETTDANMPIKDDTVIEAEEAEVKVSNGNADVQDSDNTLDGDMALVNVAADESPKMEEFTVMEDDEAELQDLESPLVEDVTEAIISNYEEDVSNLENKADYESVNEKETSFKRDEIVANEVTATSPSFDMGADRSVADAAVLSESYSAQVPSSLLPLLYTAW